MVIFTGLINAEKASFFFQQMNKHGYKILRARDENDANFGTADDTKVLTPQEFNYCDDLMRIVVKTARICLATPRLDKKGVIDFINKFKEWRPDSVKSD